MYVSQYGRNNKTKIVSNGEFALPIARGAVQMFLKREKPETDDFCRKKYLFMKEKYLVEISIFQEISGIFFTK